MKKKLFLIAPILFCISLAAFGQWTDLTSNRNDITYIDESTGWMAGNDGAFLKTTDGGKTWITQNSPVRYTLEHITKIFAFDGGNSLKVITNNGAWLSPMAIMYTSDDGGKTWARVVFRNYDIIDAHFISASVGWYWVIHSGESQLVYSTSDGGASWTPVASLDHIVDLVARGNNVWALQSIGGKSFLWRSSDSGVNWTSVQISATINTDYYHPEVLFTDDQNGWLCTGFSKSFFKTTDGGVSWTQVADAVTKNIIVSELYFVNSNVGYAYGMDSGGNKIFKTTDGGVTWNSIYQVGAGASVSVVYFNDENHGMAAGQNGFQVETNDGGNTWQVTNFCTVGSNYPAVDMAFDGDNIWAVGEILLQTSPDGKQWTVRDPVMKNNNYEENMIAFTANGKGILAGDRAFARTSDHGLTWTNYVPVEEYSSDYYNNRIWYDNAGNIWLMKSNSTLYRSVDDGQNFKIVYKPAQLGGSDRSLAFQSTSKVWYYGENTLLRTTDTGKTWTRTTEDITALQFVSEDIGWKLVSNKKVYKTINGGESWTYLTDINHWSPYNFMFFADEYVGWVGSPYGFVFKTTDGGETWNNEFTSVLNDYDVMAFSKNSQGEIVGYLGGDGMLRLDSHYKPVPVINFGEVALSAQQSMQGAVKLTWTDNSTQEDGFIVQRKLAGGTFATIATVNTATFTDNSTQSGVRYIYRVAAFKTNRATHFSNEVSIFVTVTDTSAPTVKNTSPISGSVKVEPAAPLYMVFDEMIQLGTGTLSVIDAKNQQVIVTQEIGEFNARVNNDTLLITLDNPLPSGKEVYVQLQPNVVYDIAGNGFAGINDNQWNFTVADVVAPVAITTQPLAGAIDVDPDDRLFIVFSEPIVFAGGELRVFDDVTRAELTRYTIDNSHGVAQDDTLFINLSQPLPGGKRIYLQLLPGGIFDLAGNAFAGINGDEWKFSTHDNVPPVVLSTSPEAGAIDVDPQALLVMVFNEPIMISSGTLTVLDADTDEAIKMYVVSSSSAWVNENTLTIRLPKALPGGKRVYLHFSSGVVYDYAANEFPGISDKEWRFTVLETVTGIEADAQPWKVEADQSVIRVISTDLSNIHVSDVLGRPVQLDKKGNEVQFENTGGVFIISGSHNGQIFSEKIMVLK